MKLGEGDILNIEIDIVSFHRPEKKYIGSMEKIAGKIHTYMPEFVNNIKYCSDSQGEWRYENPYDILANKKIKKIQLLTHPIWWTTPKEFSPGEKVAYHLKGAQHEKHLLAAKNCKPYELFLKRNLKID